MNLKKKYKKAMTTKIMKVFLNNWVFKIKFDKKLEMKS